MLNCCIERKKARETLGETGEYSGRTDSFSSDNVDGSEGGSTHPGTAQADVSMSSDEEFYECMDNDSEDGRPSSPGDAKNTDQSELSSSHISQSDASTKLANRKSRRLSKDLSFSDSFTHQPEGRLKTCMGLKLLNINEKLYIPVTQEPAPMTEDMLEEHAEVLAK